jgi:hypothetical protein
MSGGNRAKRPDKVYGVFISTSDLVEECEHVYDNLPSHYDPYLYTKNRPIGAVIIKSDLKRRIRDCWAGMTVLGNRYGNPADWSSLPNPLDSCVFHIGNLTHPIVRAAFRPPRRKWSYVMWETYYSFRQHRDWRHCVFVLHGVDDSAEPDQRAFIASLKPLRCEVFRSKEELLRLTTTWLQDTYKLYLTQAENILELNRRLFSRACLPLVLLFVGSLAVALMVPVKIIQVFGWALMVITIGLSLLLYMGLLSHNNAPPK